MPADEARAGARRRTAVGGVDLVGRTAVVAVDDRRARRPVGIVELGPVPIFRRGAAAHARDVTVGDEDALGAGIGAIGGARDAQRDRERAADGDERPHAAIMTLLADEVEIGGAGAAHDEDALG